MNTQKTKISLHLKMYGNISSWEAIQNYRITRLSEYIRQLREDGLDIFSEWVTDGKKHWVNYRLRIGKNNP
jgi:hypothetical protein